MMNCYNRLPPEVHDYVFSGNIAICNKCSVYVNPINLSALTTTASCNGVEGNNNEQVTNNNTQAKCRQS